MATEPIIQLQNVSVTYFAGKSNEVRASRDVSLEIYPQEYVIFFGPSGSGKSTLLNLIAGLEKASSGKVMIQGKDISQFDEESLMEFHRSTIGIIFQAFYLISNLNIRDNILLPQIFKEENIADRNKRLDKLADRFGIVPFLSKKGNELSGGQQQRVAAARALINDPHIILADEPVGNLDTKNAEITMGLLKELNEVDQKTIILVTHDPRYLPFAHRVFYIKDGQLIKTVRNTQKLDAIHIRETTELDQLAEMFPYLEEDQLTAKLIFNQSFVSLTVSEQRKVEQLIGEYLTQKITAEQLHTALHSPLEIGGVPMYASTAKNLWEKIVRLANEMNAIKDRPDEPVHTIQEKTIILRKYLLELYSGTLSEEQIVRLDNAICDVLEKRISNADFHLRLDISFNDGGVGLNSRTAKNFAHELELVLAGKIK